MCIEIYVYIYTYIHFYMSTHIYIYMYEKRAILPVKLKDMDVRVIVFCVSHIVLQVKPLFRYLRPLQKLINANFDGRSHIYIYIYMYNYIHIHIHIHVHIHRHIHTCASGPRILTGGTLHEAPRCGTPPPRKGSPEVQTSLTLTLAKPSLIHKTPLRLTPARVHTHTQKPKATAFKGQALGSASLRALLFQVSGWAQG